jgi:hypothetical protein
MEGLLVDAYLRRIANDRVHAGIDLPYSNLDDRLHSRADRLADNYHCHWSHGSEYPSQPQADVVPRRSRSRPRTRRLAVAARPDPRCRWRTRAPCEATRCTHLRTSRSMCRIGPRRRWPGSTNTPRGRYSPRSPTKRSGTNSGDQRGPRVLLRAPGSVHLPVRQGQAAYCCSARPSQLIDERGRVQHLPRATKDQRLSQGASSFSRSTSDSARGPPWN